MSQPERGERPSIADYLQDLRRLTQEHLTEKVMFADREPAQTLRRAGLTVNEVLNEFSVLLLGLSDADFDLAVRDLSWAAVDEELLVYGRVVGDLEGVNLRGADLRGRNLSGANLQDGDLRETDLSGSSLENARLVGALLGAASLRGANLKKADLSGADLQGADLQGADLSGAVLKDANFAGCRVDPALENVIGTRALHPLRVPSTGSRFTLGKIGSGLAGVRRQAGRVGLTAVLAGAAYLLAYLFRFDLSLDSVQLSDFLATLPVLLLCRVAVHALLHPVDRVRIFTTVTAGTLLFYALLLVQGNTSAVPRSVVVMEWLLSALFAGLRSNATSLRFLIPRQRSGTPAIVVGAGAASDRLLRELVRTDSGIVPVGLVDDDRDKRGMRLHGVRVVGTIADLPVVAARVAARLIIVAVPSATRTEMRRIVERCLETGLEFKIVPSMRELLQGRARVQDVRSVLLEDLLGRETVEHDLEPLSQEFSGKTVLVAGGAGSIGSEIARRVAQLQPRRLILLDQAESPLYFIHLELKSIQPELDVIPVVADVADSIRIERVFAAHRPDYVFHAAAYKHVPLMEENVFEAIRNNVLGTFQLAKVAADYGVEKFVFISTDKAVRPSSVMGATKRIAERVLLDWPSLARSGTDYRIIRFGNVLGSDGSVIPLFRRQLAAGQGLTITHPEVTRFFMTIPEAVQLILLAGTLPEAARRICALDMGEPVRILELAENLIRLSGLEPYTDVPIHFTGLRPGEKLHEESISEAESTVPTRIARIRVVRPEQVRDTGLEAGVDRLAAAAAVGDVNDVLSALRDLVPECVPPLREDGKTTLSTQTA